jgi:hypothetical protein
MRTTMTTRAEIEFLRRLPRLRCTTTVRGQLLYLPRTQDLVVPYERHPDRWRCVVLVQPGRTPARESLMWVHDVEIETALPVATADPIRDADTFTQAWLAGLWPRWPGGLMQALARELVTDLREPGTVIIDLDEQQARRLAVRHRIPVDGLRRALTNLRQGGLLHHDDEHGPWGEFTLTLPGRTATTAEQLG